MSKTSSTTLDEKDVKHIADLARLPLSEEEVQKFKGQLSSTLEYIEQLNQVDTSTVTFPPQITGLENVWREDEVKPSLSQEEALSNAPKTHKGYFVVKAIFE